MKRVKKKYRTGVRNKRGTIHGKIRSKVIENESHSVQREVPCKGAVGRRAVL